MEKLNMNEVTFYNFSNSESKNSINFVDGPQYSRSKNNKGSINGVPKNLVDLMIKVFDLNNMNEFKFSDLTNAFNEIRKNEEAKKLVLKKQEAGGFALVGTLTIIGTIILSIIIFTIIGNIVM